MFEFLRHGVESIRQFTNLCAAPKMYALRKISARQGAAGLGKNVQRFGDSAGGKNAHGNAEQDRH